MSERIPARIFRPADDDKFIEPDIIAFLRAGDENIVLVRREAWDQRTPKLITALTRLTHERPVYFGG